MSDREFRMIAAIIVTITAMIVTATVIVPLAIRGLLSI